MGLYKISSQFTDYVLSRSSNPEKILEQVSNAIEDLGNKGVPLDPKADVLEAFHSSPDVDDDFMFSHLQGSDSHKYRTINKMYETLKLLVGTGEIDGITRKMIDGFLRTWKPREVIEEPSTSPRVIRRQKGERTNVLPFELDEKGPKWESQEDRMIKRLDRASSEVVFKLLSLAGLIEKLTPMSERAIRMKKRASSWTALERLTR